MYLRHVTVEWNDNELINNLVMCYVVSNALAASDPVHPVRNGDIIQLVHGMTERPLNRYLHHLTSVTGVQLSLPVVCIVKLLEIVRMGCFTGWSLFLMFNQQCQITQGRDNILCIRTPKFYWLLFFLNWCWIYLSLHVYRHVALIIVELCGWFAFLLFFVRPCIHCRQPSVCLYSSQAA